MQHCFSWRYRGARDATLLRVLPCERDELLFAEPAGRRSGPVSPATGLPRPSAGGGVPPFRGPPAPVPAFPLGHARRRRSARCGRDRSLRGLTAALPRHRPAPHALAPYTLAHRRGSLPAQPKPALRCPDARATRPRAAARRRLDRRALRRFAGRRPLHRRTARGGVPPRAIRRALSQVPGERSPLPLTSFW